jgi:hypothetical protein
MNFLMVRFANSSAKEEGLQAIEIKGGLPGLKGFGAGEDPSVCRLHFTDNDSMLAAISEIGKITGVSGVHETGPQYYRPDHSQFAACFRDIVAQPLAHRDMDSVRKDHAEVYAMYITRLELQSP